MQFTLYTANCTGVDTNTRYPNKALVRSAADLKSAVSYDHVCALFKNYHRGNDDYIAGDADVMDCDNKHSDNPSDWIKPEMYKDIFPGVSLAVVPSRHNWKAKGDKSPRPRHHVYFPHRLMENYPDCAALKHRILEYAPFFDDGANDAARFIYGSDAGSVLWIDGTRTIDEFFDEKDFNDYDNSTRDIKEGARNSTMSRFAGRLIKRYGNTAEARKIFDEKATRCVPPLPDEELDAIWKSAVKFGEKISRQEGYIPSEEYNKEPEWEEPIPFEDYDLPPFPVDTLPAPVRDYVSALAESTQTPVDLAAASAIAVMSVCMQGKFRIKAKEDWVEPVNTFVLAVMNPSERKSAVENAMIKPLNVYESEQNNLNASLIESSKMHRRILERRQKAIEDKVAKGTAAMEEVQKIAEEIANYRETAPLKLYVDDITTEKLMSVLASNDGRAAILSTECGIFDTLSGAYSKSVNIDVMLKGYSGDCIRVDRIGRNSESIMSPALTVLLMAQPSVLSGLMQNDTFRGRGLTARFLYCMPASYVGSRRYRTQAVPPETYAAYERCIRNLLEDEYGEEPEIITLSEAADRLIEAFAEELEPKLRGEYADIADWAGKLVGNVLRIAALICRASTHRSNEFLDVPEPLVVDGDTMSAAIRIGRYFIDHAKAAYMLMGADPVVSRCRKVLGVVKLKNLSEFSRRDIMRLCQSFKTADDVQQALSRLIDYGYVAEKIPEKVHGKGRPPAPRYLVNPHVFEQ